jgi:hypothetical protein
MLINHNMKQVVLEEMNLIVILIKQIHIVVKEVVKKDTE